MSGSSICYLAVFILLSAAVFIFLGMGTAILDAAREPSDWQKKPVSFKKQGPLTAKLNALLLKRRTLLIQSHIPSVVYWAMTFGGAVGGFSAGRIVFHSLPIALAVSAFGVIAPLLFLSFRQTKASLARLHRLSSSMMILSNSYLATEDIIRSVRDNLELLEYPKPFREFLTYVTLMDSDIPTGLRRMEEQVDNPYFSQWIDALVMAQKDRSLKYVAISVVDAMHDVLRAQEESDAAMYAVWRDYLLTLVLIFSVPLIFKFLMPDAYVALTTSMIGQGLFVLLLAAVFYSVLRALKINRPLMS